MKLCFKLEIAVLQTLIIFGKYYKIRQIYVANSVTRVSRPEKQPLFSVEVPQALKHLILQFETSGFGLILAATPYPQPSLRLSDGGVN